MQRFLSVAIFQADFFSCFDIIKTGVLPGFGRHARCLKELIAQAAVGFAKPFEAGPVLAGVPAMRAR